jgi:surface antigen
MRLRLLVLCLLLAVPGCTAPRDSAADTNDGVTYSGSRMPGAMARQQALAPSDPLLDEVMPSGLGALPQAVMPTPARPRPAIRKVSQPLQCVPYARELSKIALRGNAWTWWQKAKGRYERGSMPRPGAVLVLSKTNRLRLGHLAVVAGVRSSREIVVHQANWLNRGQIHRYTPVIDVSENNDWSVVRVWYTPGRVYGSRHYPAYGFIYPKADGDPDLRQAFK